MAAIKIALSQKKPTDLACDSLIILLASDTKEIPQVLETLDAQYGGLVSGALTSGQFRGTDSETYLFNLPQGLPFGRIILAGVGPKTVCEPETIRKSVAAAVRTVEGRSASIGIVPPFFHDSDFENRFLCPALEGALLSLYRFDRYKTKKKTDRQQSVSQIIFLVPNGSDLAKLRKGVKYTESICDAVCYGRDLINLPGNDFTPDELVAEARKLTKHSGIRVKVIKADKLAKMQMNAILAVGRGSQYSPFLIIIEYNGGARAKKPLALVGKGVTFDSGGITLKVGPKMEEMKQDMAGAATVLSAIAAVAQLKVPINIVGLIPTVENMPSGNSYRPGDVIKTHSGITVEVISTDAEGRLIMADALSYSKSFNPSAVIDIATLTGAARIALGTVGCAVLGSDDDLVGKILDSSHRTGEKAWRLPLWPEFDKRLESNIADLKNTGGSDGGTIVAAKFLSKFIEGHKWAHIDIANVDHADSDGAYWREGATGFGIRLLIDVIRNWK